MSGDINFTFAPAPIIDVRYPGVAIPGPQGPPGQGGQFSWSAVPLAYNSVGVAGSMAYSSQGLYLCYATNLWLFIPGLALWS